MLVSSKLNRNDTMNGAQVKDCFIFRLLLFCDQTKEKLHLFQDFKWYFKYFDLLFAVSLSDQFLQSTEGSVMKWKWIFFCLLFIRLCQNRFQMSGDPKALWNKQRFSFSLCQNRQVFPAQYPQADMQTVDRETAWFRQVTPWKRREHALQIQGYSAAWRLKAENDVVFHTAALLRSVERLGDKYVKSLTANLDVYFMGGKKPHMIYLLRGRCWN